jgi:hypothetical protein
MHLHSFRTIVQSAPSIKHPLSKQLGVGMNIKMLLPNDEESKRLIDWVEGGGSATPCMLLH